MDKSTKDSEPDYYFDPNGAMVFTKTYHLKRGYCCKNGCRHCPYGYLSKDKKLHNELK
ncbi:DUF5522 domain-containing protein [Peijinzhouia sedimentorum]